MLVKNYILILFLLSAFSFGFGQTPDTSSTAPIPIDTTGLIIDSLPDEEIEVIKAFEAKISNARKLDIQPELPAINTTPKNYDYDITIIPLDIEYPAPVIRPLALKPEERGKHYDGWARLGYSSLNSPYLKAGYSYYIEDHYQLSVLASHTGGKEEEDLPYRKVSKSAIGLSGNYNLNESIQLKAKLSYDLDKRFLFGYSPMDGSAPDSFERKTQSLGLLVGFKSIKTNDLGLHYDLGFNPRFTQFNLDSSDELFFQTPLLVEKKLSEFNQLYLKANSAITQSSQEQLDIHYVVSADLGARLNFDKVQANFGADLLAAEDKFYAFPNTDISYSLGKSGIEAFIGSRQTHFVNNLTQLVKKAPYISHQLDSIRTKVSQSIHGGLRGRVNDKVSIYGEFGYKILNNLDLYLTSDNDLRTFSILYDDATAIYFLGKFDWDIFPWLNLESRVTKHFYSLDNQSSPWHTPSFEFEVFSTLKSEEDKWFVKAGLSLTEKAEYMDALGQSQKLNNRFDFSVEGEYNFTENIGLFIQANNLFNHSYEPWHRYPEFGINLVGGITARF